MTDQPDAAPEPIGFNSQDQKARATFRRLLLAKELYAHGLEHSRSPGALNKMIAAHNFHNAIETTLRAIMLYYDLRVDRRLNVGFEELMEIIGRHEPFIAQGRKLPYQQQIRHLTDLRNQVEHHATEPPAADMEEWRVFMPLILTRLLDLYFQIAFATLSPIDMIDDTALRALLQAAQAYLTDGDAARSLVLSWFAFERAVAVTRRLFPQTPFGGYGMLHASFGRLLVRRSNTAAGDSEITTAVSSFARGLEERLDHLEDTVSIIATGTDIVEYQQFLRFTQGFGTAYSGTPIYMVGLPHYTAEAAEWVHNFVIERIVHWQGLGLAPEVDAAFQELVGPLVRREPKSIGRTTPDGMWFVEEDPPPPAPPLPVP